MAACLRLGMVHVGFVTAFRFFSRCKGLRGFHVADALTFCSAARMPPTEGTEADGDADAAESATPAGRKARVARVAALDPSELQTLAKLALVIHNGESANGAPEGTCCTLGQAGKLRSALSAAGKTDLATNFFEFCQQSDEVRATLDLQFVFSTTSETRELGAMKRLFSAMRGGASTVPVANAIDEARQWWCDWRRTDGVAANCFARTVLDQAHKLLASEALRTAHGGKAAAVAKAVASPAAAATAQTIVSNHAARQAVALDFFKKIKEILVKGGADKDAVTSALQRLMGSYNMTAAMTGGDGCQLVARGLVELTEFDATLRATIDAHKPADFPSLVDKAADMADGDMAAAGMSFSTPGRHERARCRHT